MGAPLRLQTFGTLRLAGPANESVLGQHGHQRRRLALLAVLAAAGAHGRSRDQLLGMFWPDAPQARARHSLEQMLYVLRSSLGAEVFFRTNPVVLHEDIVTSDVAEFRKALERGDLERAVSLYTGPFLDGFFLSGAAEFEQWVDLERSRLASAYVNALERLADRAAEAANLSSATKWRRMLVEAAPLSAIHAAALIRVLSDAGDHAAALRHAEQYDELVNRELGAGSGPEVAALVREVRARAGHHDPASATGPSRPARPPIAPDVESSGAREQPAQGPPEAAPAARVRGRRAPAPVALAGLAGLVLVVVVATLGWFGPRARAGSRTPPLATSIAVLPFTNPGGNAEDALLADALTEELIAVLARVDTLRVIARTSAFAFRNSALDVRRIADTLRVAHVLEGALQRSGSRLRVQVRLIDASDGSTRWSEVYERELADALVMQREIAGAVARELDLRIGAGGTARPRIASITAYEFYLRGNDPALLRSDSAARLGMEYFRQSIAADSTFAPAYVGLARLLIRGTGPVPLGVLREQRALARQYAVRAVELDSTLGEAHAVVGAGKMMSYQFAEAERAMELAIALDPAHSRTREWRARLHLWSGRPREALAEALRAVENDPLSASAHAEVGRYLCLTGEHEAGLERLRGLSGVQPQPLRVRGYTALCHFLGNDWSAAVAVLQNAADDFWLGYALARNGNRGAATEILADFTARYERLESGAFDVAILHAGLGDNERAIEWLERAVEDGSFNEHIMLPFFADLRADRRYERVRRAMAAQKW